MTVWAPPAKFFLARRPSLMASPKPSGVSRMQICALLVASTLKVVKPCILITASFPGNVVKGGAWRPLRIRLGLVVVMNPLSRLVDVSLKAWKFRSQTPL